MEDTMRVMEYKCPCCDAGLRFVPNVQQLKCEYCDNSFDIDTVKAYNEDAAEKVQDLFSWEESEKSEWSQEEQSALRSFVCPSCGGEIITDEHTVATFCPFCDNPTILPGRVSAGLKPDGVIPFKTTREDARAAFLNLCKGKPLLPKFFTSEQRLEKITGMYVPFWLYDCEGDLSGSYKATRVHTWMDSKYTYTKTDHFMLRREADAAFARIPLDGSSKMEDAFMESIEPFDYGEIVDFDTAYLSGYLADKYDVPMENGQERIRQRVTNAMEDMVQKTFLGYATVVPTHKQVSVNHSKAAYVLLPVWVLNTRYKDKIYTFAMNGQTGKITGAFPICPKRTAAWFAGIWAGTAAIITAVLMLL